MDQVEAEIQKYKASLNELEAKALKIAEEHLESSFSITKSIGFLKWKKDQASQD
tara:strand:- start:60 stop:221 length:162 start_codon:yes stop_codon:yes gene_type:complete